MADFFDINNDENNDFNSDNNDNYETINPTINTDDKIPSDLISPDYNEENMLYATNNKDLYGLHCTNNLNSDPLNSDTGNLNSLPAEYIYDCLNRGSCESLPDISNVDTLEIPTSLSIHIRGDEEQADRIQQNFMKHDTNAQISFGKSYIPVNADDVSTLSEKVIQFLVQIPDALNLKGISMLRDFSELNHAWVSVINKNIPELIPLGKYIDILESKFG